MTDERSPEGVKDRAHIGEDWIIDRRLIDGVVVREIRSVITANSVTAEICRSDWGIVDGAVEQTIHVAMRGNAVSTWHQQRHRWDYIFAIGGHLRVVPYDPHEDSPTRGQVDVFAWAARRARAIAPGRAIPGCARP